MNATTNPVVPVAARERTTPRFHPVAAAVLNAHPRRWRALGVLCVALLLIALDTTVLNVALPTLAGQLQASTAALQWIVDGYTVALGCLLLLFGAVGDRFGRRRMLLAGLGLFAGASVLAAYAHSTNVLIGARILAGVGGAVILPSTLASVLSLFPDPHERATALGVWSATLGLGVVIGPVTGGVLLDHFWFGSVFLLNVPIAVTAFAFTFWILPESRGPRRRGRLDLPGAGLAILGAGAILWGLIEAPDAGWLSLPVLTALMVGLFTTAAFVLWERTCSAPLFPARFFASSGFRLGTASITLLFFAVYGFLFALTQDLQLRLGFSALSAGVRMLPAGVLLISAAAAPALTRRIGPRAVLSFGLLTIGAGLAVVALTSSLDSYSPIAAGLVLVGGGMGLTMPTAEDVVLSSVEPDDAGVGAGANSTNLQLGGSLGVALIGSIAITTYRHHLARLANVPPAALHAARPSLYAAAATALQLPNGVRGPFFNRGRVRIRSGPAHGVAGRRQRLHRRSCRGSQHAIAAAAKPAAGPEHLMTRASNWHPASQQPPERINRAFELPHINQQARRGAWSRPVGWTVRGHQPAPHPRRSGRLSDQRAVAGFHRGNRPGTRDVVLWLGTLGHSGVRAHLGLLDTSPHDSENMT